jgi:hypothetical protein
MIHQGKTSDQSVADLQEQIDELKRIHQYQEMELARIAVAAMEKAARLKNLIEILSSLDIDSEVQQGLITACQELVDQTSSLSDLTPRKSLGKIMLKHYIAVRYKNYPVS